MVQHQSLTFDGVAELEYLDDGGAALGVSVYRDDDTWVTLRSYNENAESLYDHALAEVIGKHLTVTVVAS